MPVITGGTKKAGGFDASAADAHDRAASDQRACRRRATTDPAANDEYGDARHGGPPPAQHLGKLALEQHGSSPGSVVSCSPCEGEMRCVILFCSMASA